MSLINFILRLILIISITKTINSTIITKYNYKPDLTNSKIEQKTLSYFDYIISFDIEYEKETLNVTKIIVYTNSKMHENCIDKAKDLIKKVLEEQLKINLIETTKINFQEKEEKKFNIFNF